MYLGATAEITVLETLVHLNGVLSAPLVLCCYALPDDPDLNGRVPLAELPHGPASAAFGGSWLRSVANLALELPSVVVPQARNMLVNILHPAIAQVRLLEQAPFRLDQRLL